MPLQRYYETNLAWGPLRGGIISAPHVLPAADNWMRPEIVAAEMEVTALDRLEPSDLIQALAATAPGGKSAGRMMAMPLVKQPFVIVEHSDPVGQALEKLAMGPGGAALLVMVGASPAVLVVYGIGVAIAWMIGPIARDMREAVREGVDEAAHVPVREAARAGVETLMEKLSDVREPGD